MSNENGFVAFYKVARWFVLLGLVVAIYLAMQDPPRPDPPDDAMLHDNVTSFETKLGTLELARRRGQPVEAHLSSDEINAAISAPQVVQAAESGSKRLPAATASASPSGPGSTLVAFAGDQATGYFTVSLYGHDLHIQLSARVGATNGYLTLDPTALKVGSLPLPAALARPVLQRTLDAPEARAKLQLPPFIGGVRVENGELVVSGSAEK